VAEICVEKGVVSAIFHISREGSGISASLFLPATWIFPKLEV
jgi:hypothetical protein